GERHSQVIVMGRPYADVGARGYQAMKDELRPVVVAALAGLREHHDVVICEGAGSPAEINLRHADLTNMGLARGAGLPVIVVADVQLRWMSNFTDADALAAEPGVRVRFTRSAADVERADLVVVPGTKATVEDLERLRATGLARALAARAAAGGPILGICGGYQLLGERIEDNVESGRGEVRGLALLPVTTKFEPQKLLRLRTGR